MPGSVSATRGRLDVHFSVELADPSAYPADELVGLAQDLEVITREQTYRDMIADLQAMAAELEADLDRMGEV